MDAKDRIAAAEKRRADRKADISVKREEQYANDLDALDALEVEHGDGAVARLDLDRYVNGHPTFVVLKVPSGAYYKRFGDKIGKAVEKNDQKKRREAQDELGEACWIYPDSSEARKAMLEEFPGLPLSIALRATQLVEAKATEEGKD